VTSNGSLPVHSKPVALLLADLGITKAHARPHVFGDNPFSEAQLKALKYRPAFQARFGSLQDARAHCHAFFPWHNVEHDHSSLAMLTPHDVHYGLAEQRVTARATVLARAYTAHPERFPSGLPRAAEVPHPSVDQPTQDASACRTHRIIGHSHLPTWRPWYSRALRRPRG
jgi:putative transposase